MAEFWTFWTARTRIRLTMKKIEYKIVRYKSKLGERLTGDMLGKDLMRVLSEQGQEGWDLKEVIQQTGLENILIFSREAAV
jgi:hypothetical protein